MAEDEAMDRIYQAVLPNSSENTEDFLIAAGKYYAMKLAMILGDLKNLNEDAIYPITVILQPYIGQNELSLLIPPIPSRGAIPGGADSGEAESEHTDGQGESFFRFLDELESGAYAADDRADEEL